MTEFIEFIKQRKCHGFWNDLSTLTYGEKVFRMTYSNGDYEIIGSSAQWVETDKKYNNTWYYVDNNFEDIVNMFDK